MHVKLLYISLDGPVPDEVKRWIGVKDLDGPPTIRWSSPVELIELYESDATQSEQANLASQIQSNNRLGPSFQEN
jgi:hypothetical protein